MPRPNTDKAAHRAGELILAWASRNPRPAVALAELADELEVNARTLSRWIAGEQEPRISDAFELKRLIKVPLNAWVE